MIVQEIITYLIVAAASGYALFQFVKILISIKNKNVHCNGCSGDCKIKSQPFEI
jgi:hypothetical protein